MEKKEQKYGTFRNEAYYKVYDSNLYKTVAVIYKSVEVLDYLSDFKKNIDYIVVNSNIEIPERFSDIKVIKINEIEEFPKTYSIVMDELNTSIMKKYSDLGFKIYYYQDRLLENYNNLGLSLEQNPFKFTNRVSIELSNICNYATIHTKCPLNKSIKEKNILPLKIVEKVLDELALYNFSGTISFHTYNEPLMDPRLFYIISLAKEKCPKCKIYILSNGFYFNQTIANDLISVGADRIDITAYSKSEYERLLKIKISKPYSIFYSPKVEDLDDRLEIYNDCSEKQCSNKPCYNVLNDIIITCDGKIDICCFDWKRMYVFGDLEKQSVKQIVNEKEFKNTFFDLAHGKRKSTMCINCIKATTKNILDFNFNGITYRNK